MHYLLVIKYGYTEFSQLCTHRAVKGWGRTSNCLGPILSPPPFMSHGSRTQLHSTTPT